jgi:hypothetical protein
VLLRNYVTMMHGQQNIKINVYISQNQLSRRSLLRNFFSPPATDSFLDTNTFRSILLPNTYLHFSFNVIGQVLHTFKAIHGSVSCQHVIATTSSLCVCLMHFVHGILKILWENYGYACVSDWFLYSTNAASGPTPSGQLVTVHNTEW